MSMSPAAPPTNIQARPPSTAPVGALLRAWRERRRLSQLELAGVAEISARHVSFLETGRSLPSREMLLKLAERLEIPLRERNALLLSAGFAPMYSERRLDDPALSQARKAIELVLVGHEPYPAVAVDRHWNVVSSNAAMKSLLSGLPPELLRPPVNVMRLALHPRGMAPRIENFAVFRAHLLERLRHQIDATGDPVLMDLLAELEAYPRPAPTALATAHGVAGSAQGAVGSAHDLTGSAANALATAHGAAGSAQRLGPAVPPRDDDRADYAGVVVPMQLHTELGLLSFFGTTTVFGTPLDITLAELAIESFFPADRDTAERLARAHSARQ